MARVRALIVALGMLTLPIGTMLTTGIPAADAAACHFVLGFKTLHHQVPSVIGACLGNEQHNPVNGDAFQPTRKGTLVWRKADNQIAFTDGYLTILDGPRGLEERLNTQRFTWEANPDGLPVVADAVTSASQLRRQVTGQTATPSATCSRPALVQARLHRSSKKTSKPATTRPKSAKHPASCASIAGNQAP